MAIRRATRRNEKAQEGNKYQCRHCANSYDWHSKALDGHLILCRCPYKQNGGKYCIFLNDRACDEHFKLREDYVDTKEQV